MNVGPTYVTITVVQSERETGIVIWHYILSMKPYTRL